jgi:hypothetical protein
MEDLMWSVDAKLARASTQVAGLLQSVTAWTTANAISARCELREGRLGYRLILEGYPTSPPLIEWGLITGECVHNLRSALDNLAYALARLHRDPPGRPKDVAFPIYREKKKFDDKGKKNVAQIPKQAAAVLERIQPFQRDGSLQEGRAENDPLLMLQSLNNTDKHRVPSVVLLAPASLSHVHEIEFRNDDEAAANAPPDFTVWTGPLKPSVVLVEMRTKHPVASVKGRSDIHAVVALETDDGPRPLDQVLKPLLVYSGMIVDQFRAFFSK